MLKLQTKLFTKCLASAIYCSTGLEQTVKIRHSVTRATGADGWWSLLGRPLRMRPSTGSPRNRRRRISATVCRRTRSSCAGGSTTAVAISRCSVASGQPASGTARGPCDHGARLGTQMQARIENE